MARDGRHGRCVWPAELFAIADVVHRQHNRFDGLSGPDPVLEGAPDSNAKQAIAGIGTTVITLPCLDAGKQFQSVLNAPYGITKYSVPSLVRRGV